MRRLPAGGARLRIGIIGSGVAGSAAGYFLRQALGNDSELVVYERNQTVGGRVQETTVAGKVVPAGASIAHSANRYFVRLVEASGLHQAPYPPKTLGIWNGQGFDFKTSGVRWRDLVRLLSRYGRSPIRVERLVKEFIRQLVPIYDRLDNGQAFASPRELFGALGLYELSQQSSADYFRRSGVSDRFLYEMIDGVSRSNYAQGSEIHALVNLVSLAGAAMGGYLFQVQEGNSVLCRNLLQAAGATLRLGAAVAEIAAGEEGGYRVTTARGEADHFDAVILATPLEVAGIRFRGMGLPDQALVNRPYQVVHVTLVAGTLDPTYFGLRTPEALPDSIMTRASPAVPFWGIGNWGRVPGSDHQVYRLFSPEELGEGLLARLFAQRVETRRLVWQAYPVLRPTPQWPPFALNPGLYYVNAMESGVSTMETEIMASRNVVNLLLREQGRATAQPAAQATGGD